MGVKVFGIFLLLICLNITKGQEVIYSENFESKDLSAFEATEGWIKDDNAIPNSSNYKGSSGKFFYGAANGTHQLETLILKGKLSTKNYTSIKISWGAYMDAAFPGPIVLQWSADGVNWKKIKFTDVKPNSSWAKIKEITLPKEAENLEKLILKWEYVSNDNANYYAIDDITVTGIKLKK